MTFIVQNGWWAVYPNTVIALRILLTLPISVAQGERSFSKLKLFKTYLRSLLGQEKLDGLAIISIEREIVENIDLNEAIEEFAKKKIAESPDLSLTICNSIERYSRVSLFLSNLVPCSILCDTVNPEI